MPTLDLFSLSALGAALAVVLSVVILAVRRAYPRNVDGMLLWGLAPLGGAAAPVVYFLLGNWLPNATVLVGQALLMTTALLFYFGSLRFLGHRPPARGWVTFVAVTLMLEFLVIVVWPDFRLRVVIFTFASALITTAHASLLWRSGPGFAARFTATVLSIKALMLAARGVSAWLQDAADTSMMAATPVQSAYIASYSITALLICLGVVLMTSERLRQEFELLANQDSLTGALSRRSVEDSLRHEFDRWQRYGQPFAVLMFDIDHFKHINDVYGHLVGDRVLIDAVAVAGQTLRTTDRLGRFGGEEFLAVLPETRLAAAIQAAERIRRALDARVGTAERPSCAVSVGVAAVADHETVDALLARADAALYRAKAQGRNRVAWDELEGAMPAPQPDTSAA